MLGTMSSHGTRSAGAVPGITACCSLHTTFLRLHPWTLRLESRLGFQRKGPSIAQKKERCILSKPRTLSRHCPVEIWGRSPYRVGSHSNSPSQRPDKRCQQLQKAKLACTAQNSWRKVELGYWFLSSKSSLSFTIQWFSMEWYHTFRMILAFLGHFQLSWWLESVIRI
jgi:hypothetical protein